MAMGPGEQQAIHPFFRQECGIPAKPTPPVPEVLLEDDPNAGRRKRRKTDKPKHNGEDKEQNLGLSVWLGHDSPVIVSPAENHLNHGATHAADEPQPLLSDIQVTTSTDQPVPPSLATDNNALGAETGTTTEKRRTLKLNSNGRLLSSPPLNPPKDTTQKTKGGKRGRPQKKESKVVTVKYSVEEGKNLGGLIDEILSGQRAHRSSTERPAVRKPKSENDPSRPTHPFFLKKPSQKPETSEAPTSDSQKPCSPSPAGTQEKKPQTGTSSNPFSSFRRRISKFAELIDPLWPPRDLVHVRGIDPSRTAKNIGFKPLGDDQKKSKVAAICINDSENVLLNSTHEARKAGKFLASQNKNSPDVLRHPGRHLASGTVVQKAMESQMSWALSNYRVGLNPSIPPVAKLRTSLLSSVTAFDRGQYEPQLWAHKYAPKLAEDVLQMGREAHVLRDWLRHLKITAVDTGKPSKESSKSKKHDKKRKKRRKQAEKLDGFIVSSGEEASEMDNLSGSDDELAGDVTVSAQKTVVRSGDLAFGSVHGSEKGRITNAILLSGPSGCGKTASVYAVANELDFEVFEINPGSRRSGRDMLERVGDMTQNHLVHLLNESDEPSGRDETMQNKLRNFFKAPPLKTAESHNQFGRQSPQSDGETKRAREQKQSLILLEEADILFDEDRQFWTGVLTLISQSRRPIIITCNDESLVPTQDMSLHAILRYQKPPHDLIVDYLLLVAANEGHLLKREAASKLYQGSGLDLRRALMDLNFWCQMGVGSEKAGLDWILPRWPPGSNVDPNGDRMRVLSLNTYEPLMGWFNRDMILSPKSVDNEAEALRNSLHWWDLGIQDSDDVAGRSEVELLPSGQFQTASNPAKLELLQRESDYLEMRSSLDLLSSRCPLAMKMDAVDISAPSPPEGYRSNYTESHPLLHTDLQPEHSSLSEAVGTTFGAILSQAFRPKTGGDIESIHASRVLSPLNNSTIRQPAPASSVPEFRKAFEPIIRANYTMPLPTGRLAPSWENGLSVITEDLAPYIRGIMVFDGRLKEYRDGLNALLWQEQRAHGQKRIRTTRASRAALEGGDKSSTRKERWFPDDTNYFAVQRTGKPEWQEALFRMGHFHVQPTPDLVGESSDHASDG
ncbi:hypothetical protein NUU61_004470 [Penicillium alfredii]|uniref:AAA+ ATPase domain-containing protein n=1 Tax=Penicillium alfredii TaxID=1506179 RepID=A0A9W9FL75_9EURO|nr:uncharacterized protein NUU61_004470 [Penicillium alfredii]KAJ5102248.1 hypothetical protein NUU61_004470 [Penicillium alfredii]